MSLHRLKPGQNVTVDRGQPVVCIPVYGAYELFVACVRSALEHTPPAIPVLVADDASRERRIETFLEELDASGNLGHSVYYLRQPRNLGFVANANAAFEAVRPGDVLLLNSDCVVSEGWIEGLRAAAYDDSRVATASALTNHGTILSVPHRNTPVPHLPHDWTLEAAAAAIKERSLRLRPRIPTAIGHCFYVRRSALDLVGNFDESFSPGYGEEVDFSQRCLLHGLSHVVADDVFVFHRGGGTFDRSGEAGRVQTENEALIRERYPYYHSAVDAAADAPVGPLPRALTAAREALRGVSVTIDARILGPLLTGTQVVVLELINALRQREGVRVRVLVPDDLGDYADALLADMSDVTWVTEDDAEEGTDQTDIVHRPFQVSYPKDLRLLRRLGQRVVITHLDLIAYENPGYFPSFETWEAYRRTTRQALTFADRVIFISRAAAREATEAELIEESRLDVVYPGADHRLGALRPEPRQPAGMPDGAAPFLLCIGTNYRHKNRLFALRILDELQGRHGWEGRLVLAGPQVPFGSSAGDEAEYLSMRPRVAAAVVDLPAVTEAEKAWLLGHAAAVLYPTIYEGFGFVPFEAAELEVPCLFAPGTALEEILPRETARLVPWDAGLSADQIIDVVTRRGTDNLVSVLQETAKRFTWEVAAGRTLEVYRATLEAPTREAVAIAAEAARLERVLQDANDRYTEVCEAVGEEGLSLVGPNGVLPADMRRPLLAVATRGWLRGPVFGALRFPYQVARRMRTGDGAKDEAGQTER